MAVRNKELIAATITAENSSGFSTVTTTTIMPSAALGSGETITLEQSIDGATWYDCIIDSTTQEITSTNSLITIVGPGYFRVAKSVTSAAISVNMFTDSSSR